MNLDNAKAWIGHRLSRNSVARNTLWMILARGVRVVLQSVYFVIVARSLGVAQYGTFVGVTALAGIINPFVTLGSGHVLVKNVSRNRSLFNEYWGNALFMTCSSALVLIVLMQFCAQFFLPTTISPLLIFLVLLSDLFFLKILDTSTQAFQAVYLLNRAAQVNVLLSISRLISALVLAIFFQKPEVLIWGFLYLTSTAVSALVAFLIVNRMLGSPKLAIWRIKSEIVEGFYFSVGWSATTIYNDIDKTMLARFSTLEATGIYAAAYRIIEVALVPIRSLAIATFPNFFKHGATGINGGVSFAKRLLPAGFAYGAVAVAGLFFLAPVVPFVLGAEYNNSVEALRLLAPLPLLKSIHIFAANTLTGADLQGIRCGMEIVVAIFNVLINLWVIPLYSWRGAGWSSIASDSLLMLGLWGIVWFKSREKQV